MSYQKPLVQVFQEYAQMSVATQDATLYPCIIGPCYSIIDAVEDEALAFVSEYDTEGLEDVLFPNNPAGAVIKEESITFRFKDPVAEMSEASIDVDSTDQNVLTFLEGDFPNYTETGDIVYLTDVTDPMEPVPSQVEFRVIDIKAAEFKIFLNKSPVKTLETTVFAADLFRRVDDLFLDATSTAITLDLARTSFSVLGVEVDVNGVSKLVDSATLYVGYRSLRTDLTNINTVYNTSEAEGLLGKLDTNKNPLGLGARIALGNTTVGIKVIGIGSDDSTGYTAAKDRLENYEDVYSIVALTQDTSVLNIFNLHAQQMSLPENGNWRVALGSVTLPEETLLQDGMGETKLDGDGDLILFSDPDAQFLSNDVTAGTLLKLTNGNGDEGEFTVALSISEDLLAVDPTTPFGTEFPVDTFYSYEVIRELNRTEQAREMGSISESFGSQRFIHVFPDKCEIENDIVPGYYLACAVAGAAGGLPSHHGFTRLSIAGIDRLYNSGDYFNQDQLDTIAGGGTFIFTQENPQAAPVIRHQLTTDMSTIELSEFSFVKNFDYTSILSKRVLDAFLGQYNITPATLAILDSAMRSLLKTQKLYNLPRIGSPILDFEIAKIQQLDDTRDRVEMYVNVQFPYVLNTVGLHLISQ